MQARPLPALLVALLLPLAACLAACKGESDSAPKTDAKPDLAPQAKAATEAIPAELKGKIEFEVKELDEGNILAVVPVGWKPGFMPGSFEPATEELGQDVSYGVDSNCDGTCTQKDWRAVTEKVEFSSFSGPTYTVESDEPLGETGRMVVYSGGPEVHIRAAWWTAESNRYFHCRADLAGPTAMAKQAFIQACKATHVVDWD